MTSAQYKKIAAKAFEKYIGVSIPYTKIGLLETSKNQDMIEVAFKAGVREYLYKINLLDSTESMRMCTNFFDPNGVNGIEL